MTNETKPVLLTVAMAEALGAMSPECRVKMLRERGLIVPEPVDALLEKEANRLAVTQHAWDTANDYNGAKALALAALRRGMELAKPELTREMVREAVNGISYEVFECGSRDTIADRLHAALQGQSK